MEITDRGSPHIHCVLWTDKSVPELMEIDNLIVADIPDTQTDRTFFHQVTILQQHRCTTYCMRQEGICRFRFPHMARNETVIENDFRVHL